MSLEVHGPYISLEIAALTFPRASFAVLRLWCNQNGLAGHASGSWLSALGAGVPYNQEKTKV